MLDRSRLALVTLLCATLWALPASAATIEARSVAEMTEASAAVVQAKVESSTVERGEMGLVTRHQLTVESWWTGAGPSSITVSQVGGRQGDRIEKIHGDMELEPGDRIVIFLAQGPDSYWGFLLGWSVFHIDGTGSDAAIHRDAADLGLMRRNKAGLLVKVEPGQLAIPDTLSQLKQAVDAVKGGAQ